MKKGDLKIIKKFYKNGNLQKELIVGKPKQNSGEYYFELCCWYGHVQLCQWIHTTFLLTREEVTRDNNLAFRWACKRGHLIIAEWLYITFQLTKDDIKNDNNYALTRAMMYDHYDVAEFLFTTCGLTEEDIDESFLCRLTKGKQKKLREIATPLGALTKPVMTS